MPRWEEARDNLETIAQGLAAYYAASGPDCHFPDAPGETPLANCCQGHDDVYANEDDLCEGTEDAFATPSWQAVGFVPAQPHVFLYKFYERDGQMVVYAEADQDCDDARSTFQRFVRPVPSDEGCAAEVVPGFYSDQQSE